MPIRQVPDDVAPGARAFEAHGQFGQSRRHAGEPDMESVAALLAVFMFPETVFLAVLPLAGDHAEIDGAEARRAAIDAVTGFVDIFRAAILAVEIEAALAVEHRHFHFATLIEGH